MVRGGRLFELVLNDDCVEALYSYLDTQALVMLSMVSQSSSRWGSVVPSCVVKRCPRRRMQVSRGLKAQAQGHLRVIEGGAVLQAGDALDGVSCLGR